MNRLIKISKPIIVEGKYDKITLENVVDALIIPTDGFGIFKNKEKILAYFDGLYKFNNLRFEEYELKLELLEKERNKISEKEFAQQEEEIKKRYEKSLNKIQDYFSAREKEILESSEEEIDALYNML